MSERLNNWDANKANHEIKQWEDELYGEAGKSDFSDEARKVVEEASAYEDHMEGFIDDGLDADVRYQQDVENGKVKDSIDRAIESSVELRRMDMMARQIAELRSGEQTEDTIRMIKDKEDKLNELLEQYSQPQYDPKYLHGPNEHHQAEMEGVKKDAIIDRIINRTVNSEIASSDSDETDSPEGDGPDDTDPEGGPSAGGAEADGTEAGETGSEDSGETGVDTDPDGDGPSDGESDDDSDKEKNDEGEDGEDTIEAWSDLSDAERECIEVLQMSRREYAEITASERESVLRRVMLDKNDTWLSKLVKKVPFVQSVIDRFNNDTPWAQEVEQARSTYETNLRDWLTTLEARLDEEAFIDDEQRRQLLTSALLCEDQRLESEIVEFQHETGRDGNKFTDWWVRQKGLKGNLKKAAVVFGGGLLAGAAAGTGVGLLFGAGAAASYAGLAAGAAFGVSTGVHVTNRRANSFIDDDETTVAEADSEAHHERKSEAVRESADRYDEIGLNESRADFMTSDLVKENEDITDEDAYRNRRRVRRMASIAAAGGSIGGAIAGNIVGNAVHGGGNGADSASSQFKNTHGSGAESSSTGGGTTTGAESGGGAGATTGGGEAASEAGKAAAEVYHYGYGAAPENLLRQVAHDQLGQNLSGDQAYKLINQLYSRLGDGVFSDVNLTLHSPGNVWIQNPGGDTAGLTKEAITIAKQLIASGKI